MKKFKKIILFGIIFYFLYILINYLFHYLRFSIFSINLSSVSRGLHDCYEVSGFPFAVGHSTSASTDGRICLVTYSNDFPLGIILNLTIQAILTLVISLFCYRFLGKKFKI